MEEKFFLVQIKRTNGKYEKGVVVKDSLDDARQGFHAYLGAYGYGHDANTDYVACYTIGMYGEIFDSVYDDRIPSQEEAEEL